MALRGAGVPSNRQVPLVLGKRRSAPSDEPEPDPEVEITAVERRVRDEMARAADAIAALHRT